MTKRQNPFADDVPMQSKVYVTNKEMDRCSQKRFAIVHAKTLKMLFSGSRKAAEASQEKSDGAQGNSSTCSSCPRRGSARRCSFCDRPVCSGCVRTCSSCEDVYCPLCSLLRYDRCGEVAVCLSCNSK